ncbi:MAG: PD-(D/E)XK nuclease family protein [Microbacteriaceae bacterium]|nr:PD-(D/E)XK nuclease family protein [Microbacteriaceae bacterium]
MNTKQDKKPVWDELQNAVLKLNPEKHAVVLGVPGTGKTALLLENAVAHWGSGVRIIGANRRVAARLRDAFISRFQQPVSGKIAETMQGFAFGLLQQHAAEREHAAPRLLTAAAQDELLGEALAEKGFAALPGAAKPPQLRTELREMWQVLDDYCKTVQDLPDAMQQLREQSRVPAASVNLDYAKVWQSAADVLESCMVVAERGEYAASSVLAQAAWLVFNGEITAQKLPKLLLIDDAQELNAGEIRLLAVLAERGVKIWLFGDPDSATGSFYGAANTILADFENVLQNALPNGAKIADLACEKVTLNTVYRHGGNIRGVVHSIAERCGSGAGFAHRQNVTVVSEYKNEADFSQTVHNYEVTSESELVGAIAYELRRRHLGVDGAAPVPWQNMVVVCRSRVAADQLARELEFCEVPCATSGGGIVLRDHAIVCDLVRLLRAVTLDNPLSAAEIIDILAGPLYLLDMPAQRRLRAKILLELRREAIAQDTAPLSVDVALQQICAGSRKIAKTSADADMVTLAKLAQSLQNARKTLQQKQSVRIALWQLWQATGRDKKLQKQAINGSRLESLAANAQLDAVMALFFAIQRNEEQENAIPLAQLLHEIEHSELPQDTLAQQANTPAVTVTTPHALIGQEFDIAVIADLQSGVWPNTKLRGSILGANKLAEYFATGTIVTGDDRQQIKQDEARLLHTAASRAKNLLLAFTINSENSHPSQFAKLFGDSQKTAPKLNGFTLRGAVAHYRAKLEHNPADAFAAAQLAYLAARGYDIADPQNWYGIDAKPVPVEKTTEPENLPVQLSPSTLQRASDCPLQAALDRILGNTGQNLNADIGTLVHAGFEMATQNPESSVETIMPHLTKHWHKLAFEADWIAQKNLQTVHTMLENSLKHLRDLRAAGWEIKGCESAFQIVSKTAVLNGRLDLIAVKKTGEQTQVRVIDLKTTGTAPSGPKTKENVQLRAYQFAVKSGALNDTIETDGANAQTDAAIALVHPKTGAKLVEQPEIDEQQQKEFTELMQKVAAHLSGTEFLAATNTHCNAYGAKNSCEIHLIDPVSAL